ncbi:hypothetical protein C8J57DRAFT_1259590 [Mycena rebaudengoi]|nr:hypothetical protein C8J57DRAFT_1259590 [Mycena rebaudengoi]
MPMPEWASDFDPAMLTGEEVGMPTLTQGAAVEASPTPSRPAPQIRLPPGNAAPLSALHHHSAVGGTILQLHTTAVRERIICTRSHHNSHLELRTTATRERGHRTSHIQLWATAAGEHVVCRENCTSHLQLRAAGPPLTAAFFAPVATTLHRPPTTPLAYTLPRPPPTTVSSRTNALGQTARIPMMAKDIVLTVLAAPQAASGSQASIAPPIGAPAVTPTPSPPSEPPPAKKPAKGVFKGQSGDDCSSHHHQQQSRLQSPEGRGDGAEESGEGCPAGASAVTRAVARTSSLFPSHRGERKCKELGDGSIAVLPRKRTRKELDEERVEALMLARRDPNKVREPEKNSGEGERGANGPKPLTAVGQLAPHMLRNQLDLYF